MEYYKDDFYEDSDNDEEFSSVQNEFINNVEEYYKSILKYREDHKNELDIYWKPNYNEIKAKFEEIMQTIHFSWIEAKKIIETLPCFKYDNFFQYVYNVDFKNTKHIKGTVARAKTIRRSRSNICPKCNIECKVTKEMDVLKCPKCGYEIMKDKAGVPDNMINGEKHIRKHIDKLIGLSKIPQNLVNFLPYLSIWLTEWKYIYEWLIYSNRYDNFIDKYVNRSGNSMLYEKDFNVVISKTEENRMEFCVYELFTEEFYKMTELVSKLFKKITNIYGTKEFIIDIIDNYMKDNNIDKFRSFNDLPEENVTYIYKGVEYSIGIYLNKLGLIYTYSENDIKNDIIKRFCYNGEDCLRYPGVMFNFNEVVKGKSDIPKSFMYSENYNKIMNEIFHSSFIDIPPSDINKIVDILLKFNDYYKKHVKKDGKKEKTKTNSPLFVCVFKCIIISFKYFSKYVSVLDLIPHRLTESNTKNEIDCLWNYFLALPENKELIDQYNYDDKLDTTISTIENNNIESIRIDEDLENIL